MRFLDNAYIDICILESLIPHTPFDSGIYNLTANKFMHKIEDIQKEDAEAFASLLLHMVEQYLKLKKQTHGQDVAESKELLQKIMDKVIQNTL